MNFGYTVVSQDSMSAAFGQILPPLSTARGHYRTSSGTTTRSGSWWVATNVVDNGNGSYTATGDYIGNLARAKYESSLSDTVTSNGLFMAQPLSIVNGIIYAYIPVSFTLDNIVTNLEITQNRTMVISKGSVTFQCWNGNALFAHQAAPTPDASEIASGKTPVLGLQDCRANVFPFVIDRTEGFIVPLLAPASSWSSRNGVTTGVFYKAASPCCWTTPYPGGATSNYDVGVKEDLENWLHEAYLNPQYFTPFVSDLCFCGFEYSNDVPSYIVYV